MAHGDDEFNVETISENQSGAEDSVSQGFRVNAKYLFAGIFFGIILVKSQVVSWYRIQEMFRLQAFHMYGVLCTAIGVGLISMWAIQRFKVKTLTGENVIIPQKELHKGNVLGGLVFGLGWALTGACPGPLFAQIGSGFLIVVVTFFSALAGTWTYGFFREKLPH